jgi:hypothetical protein
MAALGRKLPLSLRQVGWKVAITAPLEADAHVGHQSVLKGEPAI